MNDNSNLFKKGDERTRKMARKGGKASGEARRKRKKMKESLEVILTMPLDKGKIKELESIKTFKDIGKANISVQDSLLHSLIVTSIMGGKDGIAATKLIYEILGEQDPVTTQQVTNIYDTSFLKEKTDEELRLLLERRKGGDDK